MKTRNRKTAKRHSTCIRKPPRKKAHVVALWPSKMIKAQLRGGRITHELLAECRMRTVRAIFYNGNECQAYEPIEPTREQKRAMERFEKLMEKQAAKLGPENVRRRQMEIELTRKHCPEELPWAMGGGR